MGWLGWVWMIAVALGGNERGTFVGADASITAGAHAAVTRDAEALWYNPAGLGGLDRNKLNLSLSAFALRVRPAPSFITTSLGDASLSADVTANDFFALPGSVVLVRKSERRVHWGLGVFATQADRINVRHDRVVGVDVGAFGPSTYTEGLNVFFDSSQLAAGGAAGWRVTDTLRIGWAVFAEYTRQFVSWDVLSSLSSRADQGRTNASLNRFEVNAFNAIGLFSTLGIQWEFAPHWSMGVVIRTPTANIVQWGETARTATVTVPGEGTATVVERQSLERFEFSAVNPMRFSLSFGIRYPKWWVGIEGEVALPLVDRDRGLNREMLINVSLGAKAQLAERWWGGIGVFTDREASNVRGLFSERLDFYGVTLGPELQNPVRIGDRADALVFSTTVGIRYAFGVGPFGAMTLDPVSVELGTRDVRYVFHELTAYLGSSLAF